MKLSRDDLNFVKPEGINYLHAKFQINIKKNSDNFDFKRN